MGYEVSLIKPQELDSKFKSTFHYSDKELEEEIESAKLELIIYCMQSHEVPKIKDLRFRINMLILLLEEQSKKNIEHMMSPDNEEEAWLCGWQYSKECDFTKEDIINMLLKDLTILAYLVKTPDYFEEREKFYEKLNQIEEALSEIDSNISEIMNHELIALYKGEESY